ncbi:antibiotic biosynthesis monooxygenase family protein [Simiduia aestuariiviva]|uniref:Heme-degrading monooxygenase HmoA n=1 Tax=Simiduia aestuariiviva TaxID=1510459 RepID=A0A839UJ85_9GAMM|nr:antibiotic biosynthesis monooxygenase [Simiduia aestuariiviva]MBB3167623.1 heme-degrading monooxygenase HmoA [Simiduia aestuariiviva]
MIVATSRFVVANDKDAEVAEAFVARPHKVDAVEGFLKMEVLRNITNPKEFMLLTYWNSESCYKAWHKSHMYGEAHAGIPKGLKLEKRETIVTQWSHLTD